MQRWRGSLLIREKRPARRATQARDLDLAGRRVRSLGRSVSVVDKWLEDNDGLIDDAVRVRRITNWREEALAQIKISSAT